MPQGINTGEILEALNDKMDRDGHNVQSPTAVIVETYDDGNGNGYLLYSNNYCVQYGVYDNGTKAADFYTTVTFTKPFVNTNYFSTAQEFNLDETAAYRDGTTNIYQKSTTNMSFGFYRNGYGYRYISWKAEGYIA